MSADLQQAVLGIGVGSVYALLAVGLQVTYRASGVLNFAEGAFAMLGAYLEYDLTSTYGWPFGLAAVASIVAMAFVGFAFHYVVMARLREASPLARVIATLGLFLVLVGVATARWGGDDFAVIPTALPDRYLRWGRYGIGEDRLWMLAIAVASSVVIWAIFRFTTVGIATSAAAENERAAASLGWSGDLLAAGGWALGSGMAALAGILVAPVAGLEVTTTSLIVIPALAVSLLAGFGSFLLTPAVAVAVGCITAVFELHTSANTADALPFIVIIVALVVRGHGLPIRGFIFDRPPSLGSGRFKVRTLVVALLLFGATTRFLLNVTWQNAIVVTFAAALIMLSIVVLTGYAGQLSLAQYAIGGLGAVMAANLVSRWGLPFELAFAIAVLLSIPVGLVFALPALRTRGVNLAIVTLAMAVAANDLVFSSGSIAGGYQGFNIGRLTFLGVDINPITRPGNYAVVTLVVFSLAAIGVANLRRSPAGRQVLSVRTNERAAASLGVNVVGAKLYAFAVSAAIAAMGGILLAFQTPPIEFSNDNAFQSIQILAYGVIGGVGYVLGPIFGSPLVDGSVGTVISNWLQDHSVVAVVVVAVIVASAARSRIWATVTSDSSGVQKTLRLVRIATGAVALVLFVWWVLNDPDSRLPLAGGVALLALLVHDPNGIASDNVRAYHRALDRFQSRWDRQPSKSPRSEHEPPPLAAVRQHFIVEEKSLDVHELTVAFGGVRAVNGLSIRVEPGTVVGLIGPNGAGKTTVIDAISGFVRPSSGTVSLGGRTIDDEAAFRRVRSGLTRSFQSLELFDDLTLRENFHTAADIVRPVEYLSAFLRQRKRVLPPSAAAALEHFHLGHALDTQADELPYGDRRLSAIARAVATRPSVLLLDEPVAGLGDLASAELAELIRDLAERSRMAILVVEHAMNFVMRVCDHIVVLNFGEKIAEGTPEEVQSNPAVIEAYLGQARLGTPVELALGQSTAEFAQLTSDSDVDHPKGRS